MALLMTMEKQSDRELLELAAKAAGMKGEYTACYGEDFYYHGNTCGILIKNTNGSEYVWNPIDDYGDALRLAVKLMLKLDVRKTMVSVELYVFNETEPSITEFFDDNDTSRSEATRRAIVRAAAATARRMQDEQSTAARS